MLLRLCQLGWTYSGRTRTTNLGHPMARVCPQVWKAPYRTLGLPARSVRLLYRFHRNISLLSSCTSATSRIPTNSTSLRISRDRRQGGRFRTFMTSPSHLLTIFSYGQTHRCPKQVPRQCLCRASGASLRSIGLRPSGSNHTLLYSAPPTYT